MTVPTPDTKHPPSPSPLSAVPAVSAWSLLFAALLLLATALALHVAGPLAHTHRCDLRAAGAVAAGGWHDTDISTASQGKLWKPRAFRSMARSLRFQHGGAPHAPHDTLGRVGPTCQRWAVLTTIFAPTKLVRQLRALTGWCVVVVGDRKTNDSAWDAFVSTAPTSSVYLSARAQERLPYSMLRHVPWNHFGRKNVGYLYAVHHGAQVLLDMDDDNELQVPSEIDQLVAQAQAGDVRVPLVDVGHHLWNPYPFFRPTAAVSGNPVSIAWPRGFPLPFAKDTNAARTCAVPLANCNSSRTLNASQIGVFQSLADNDPDVDAMYRLSAPLPLSFPRPGNGPRAVALPALRMAPFNAQATVWTRHAMWALLLPVTVHGRASDIWRSYVAQRMFADVGLHVAFTTPLAMQFRNLHSLVADLQAEVPLYTQASELVRWLAAWSHGDDEGTGAQLEARFEKLFADLFAIGIVDEADVLLLQAWLGDLRSVGYMLPPLEEDFEEGHTIAIPKASPYDVARVASCIRLSAVGDVRAARDGVARRDGDAHVDVFVVLSGADETAEACAGMADVSRHCQVMVLPSATDAGSVHKACGAAVAARGASFGRYDWVTSDVVGTGAIGLPTRQQLIMQADRPTVWQLDDGTVISGRADWFLQVIAQPGGLRQLQGPVQVRTPPPSFSSSPSSAGTDGWQTNL